MHSQGPLFIGSLALRRTPRAASTMRVLHKIRELIAAHLSSRHWSYALRTRYTRALEEEIARLRAENRALVNSILGVAGIPPMCAAAARSSNGETFVGATLGSPGRGKPRPYERKSVRRRSWQQIGRALEIEDARAARRERESDTETFPAPRNVVSKLS